MRNWLRSIGFLAAVAGASMANAAPDPLAPTGHWTASTRGAAKTPPMGWNSWNAFRTDVDEAKVMGAAQALLDTGLARLGYRYVNLDDGWWLKRRISDGRLQVRTADFPSARVAGPERSSFRAYTDRLHAMGLKAGIYTDLGRNACSQAFDLNSPTLPVGTRAEREVGLYGHIDQDIRLFFKDWGFDYIKVDACGLADYAPGNPILAGARLSRLSVADRARRPGADGQRQGAGLVRRGCRRIGSLRCGRRLCLFHLPVGRGGRPRLGQGRRQ